MLFDWKLVVKYFKLDRKIIVRIAGSLRSQNLSKAKSGLSSYEWLCRSLAIRMGYSIRYAITSPNNIDPDI